MNKFEVIIKDTHRGLKYVDGVLTDVLGAGYYQLPRPRFFGRTPTVEVVLVDIRQRDLTIKGQEILTADKVAIRVSILVQFAVTDPKAALQIVANYEDRLYSDVQLAARRSLASMALEEILTNRSRLNDDILHEVKESAAGYGVAIRRADVKDIVFPGNLQEIMNRVLAAERTSKAQLIDAQTKAEVQEIEAKTRASAQKIQAEADAVTAMRKAESEVAAIRLKVQADREAAAERGQTADVYRDHPALLRLEELATLRELARNANARIYLDFKKRDEGPMGE